MHERYADNMPLIGQLAPSFQVKAINGAIDFPDDFEEKWVVVFSIPRDLNPNLALEPEFIEIIDRLEKNNTRVIGLCGDSIYRYINFCDQLKKMKQGEIQNIMKIFFVVEDADKIIAKKLCMINTEFQFMTPVEPVFIIDPFRRIRCIQNYNDPTWKNLMEINHIVTALRNADAEKTGDI
jgi:peroxiredoxin (alkyl hydroperoxide reductase subunit C)